jgi:hypothetical protein
MYKKHTLRSKTGQRPETTMSPRELVETALRALAAWTDGRKPASADLNILKEAFYHAAMSAVGRCDSERAS